jgi:thiol:disulfide interchange protein DsbC
MGAALPAVATDAVSLAQVAAKLPGAKAEDLRTTPVPGVYEYRRGAELAYVTADGRYAFAGDLYQLSNNANLSDARRRELRRNMLAAMPESNMVVFAPKDSRDIKYTISVFTDVDCSYCRMLHKQIEDYNKLGIKVRYLSFPRTGPDSDSWTRAEQVWCAADRKAMLTRAKLSKFGEVFPDKVCSNNPVAKEYALGLAMGLNGTPGIITDTGELLAGYLPPKDMLEMLKSSSPVATIAGAGQSPMQN